MADDWQKVEQTYSPSMGKLAEALSKAQGAMTGALKDASNPFFKSRYADLESVWSACRKPLSDNGLAVIQTTDFQDSAGIRIITTLVHSSGEWIRGVLPIMAKDATPQGTGSALTYSRRYALAAIVGVFQTDDDGQQAQQEVAQQPQRVKHTDPRIKDYLDRLNITFQSGMRDPVLDILNELAEDQDLKVAVWGKLPSGMRAQMTDWINEARAEAKK